MDDIVHYYTTLHVTSVVRFDMNVVEGRQSAKVGNFTRQFGAKETRRILLLQV
jgi:hypothetical protein